MTTAPSPKMYIPSTPGGTPLFHLKADSEEQAWTNLVEDAKHMPYDGVEGFKARGYTVDEYTLGVDDGA